MGRCMFDSTFIEVHGWSILHGRQLRATVELLIGSYMRTASFTVDIWAALVVQSSAFEASCDSVTIQTLDLVHHFRSASCHQRSQKA